MLWQISSGPIFLRWVLADQVQILVQLKIKKSDYFWCCTSVAVWNMLSVRVGQEMRKKWGGNVCGTRIRNSKRSEGEISLRKQFLNGTPQENTDGGGVASHFWERSWERSFSNKVIIHRFSRKRRKYGQMPSFTQKIPSEMEVAPRYTLLTLFTMFSLFIPFKLCNFALLQQ